jgi:hypothetical protein
MQKYIKKKNANYYLGCLVLQVVTIAIIGMVVARTIGIIMLMPIGKSS